MWVIESMWLMVVFTSIASREVGPPNGKFL